jgi:hypothetical protein
MLACTGELLIRLARRHVTALHRMPPPRPRRLHIRTLAVSISVPSPSPYPYPRRLHIRTRALAGGEAIPRCPTGLPLCYPYATPLLDLFDSAIT